MLSIYQKLGGDVLLHEIIDRFYCRVLDDKRINFFFSGVNFDGADMEKQIRHQRAFLKMVLGGGTQYSGRSLQDAHVPLVEQGLSDTHFDAMIENLKETLMEMKVEAKIIQEIVALVEQNRPIVLGQDPTT